MRGTPLRRAAASCCIICCCICCCCFLAALPLFIGFCSCNIGIAGGICIIWGISASERYWRQRGDGCGVTCCCCPRLLPGNAPMPAPPAPAAPAPPEFFLPLPDDAPASRGLLIELRHDDFGEGGARPRPVFSAFNEVSKKFLIGETVSVTSFISFSIDCGFFFYTGGVLLPLPAGCCLATGSDVIFDCTCTCCGCCCAGCATDGGATSTFFFPLPFSHNFSCF